MFFGYAFQTGKANVHGHRHSIIVLIGLALLLHVVIRSFSIRNPAVKKAVLKPITLIMGNAELALREHENSDCLFILSFHFFFFNLFRNSSLSQPEKVNPGFSVPLKLSLLFF